ncbi:Hypothetical_protein [Hexamita inflata]|uniref:Hypothetical_protein n=1 Tax=Hexamita inflata TaxID=28002 RepID=A0AA86UAM0_9EUKA|nr:Hypothetical protein HINF_LOCUS22683 [Hexamita inflata]
MQNGLKYVFCLKGNQGSKRLTQNVVLQSLSKFRGGLLFGAKQLNQVKISSQLASSTNIDQFSLNLVSEKLTISQSIVNFTIQNSLTNLAEIQKFGSNIKLQYSEINITFSSVKLMCFGIGSQVSNLQINQLLFNLTCLDRSYYTNGLAMNLTSPVINSLQLNIQIPNAYPSQIFAGFSREKNKTNLIQLKNIIRIQTKNFQIFQIEAIQILKFAVIYCQFFDGLTVQFRFNLFTICYGQVAYIKLLNKFQANQFIIPVYQEGFIYYVELVLSSHFSVVFRKVLVICQLHFNWSVVIKNMIHQELPSILSRRAFEPLQELYISALLVHSQFFDTLLR